MELVHLYDTLNQYAEDVIATYRNKLQENNVNSSHELERSLDYRIEETDGEIKVILISADHIEQVENGRLPTKNGGTGEVQRKIEEWIIQKPIIPRPSRNGTLPTIKQLAYLISHKIHIEGYHGKGLLKETINEVYQRYEDKINQALDDDVAEYVLVHVQNILKNI